MPRQPHACRPALWCNNGAMRADLNEILDQLEDEGTASSEEALYTAFSDWAAQTGRPLYPHQEEALLELLTGSHVIAQTPTGSGKSLIALAGHFLSLARGGRSYYTAPLKALVSEKFFDLVNAFGAANVGMITGDVSLNADAPIICCTAEILANQALREGSQLDADMVIMDEFHFYADPQRGWAWQIPLLELTSPQFVALSATLGDTAFLAEDLQERTGRTVAVVSDAVRPVPLDFEYLVDDLPDVVERLLKEGRAPIYIVHFAQRDAVSTAKTLERLTLVSKAEKRRLQEELAGEKFGRGFGQTLRSLLVQGIGVHHAGMLPRYRRLVERLTQQGLLKVICGTDTLGVGINVPIRTVLFTSLIKFDGVRTRHLSAREFHQIAGRAGRAGFDDVGHVRILGSEAEIERAKHQARLTAAQEAADTKKLKKLAQKQARKGGRGGGTKSAAAGKISWNRGTFDRLVAAAPETLRSRFVTNHALFLNALQGPGDPEARLIGLAKNNHDQPEESNPHLRSLGDIYRSLRQAGVIDRVSEAEAKAQGRPRLRAVRDLPDDFALNQPLAPFALAAFELLDPDSPDFTLDLVSVVEAVMDNPAALLRQQQRQARDEALRAMKDEGVEYGDRMEALEEVTWPRPLRELIEPAFAVFSQTNPWVGQLEPSPKSVVRFMIENAMTFSTLISYYDLGNAEGVILRYLTDVYRALGQIPPARYQTPELGEVTDWLGVLVRSVDSSLLDEWERLAEEDETGAPARALPEPELEEQPAFGADVSGRVSYQKNPHALRRAVRQQVFRTVELLSRDGVDRLGELYSADGWDADRWYEALGKYWAEHEWIGIDHRARSGELFHLNTSPETPDLMIATGATTEEELPRTAAGNHEWWLAEQVLLDPAEDGDWLLTLLVDVPASVAQARPVLRMLDFSVR